jgi:hypothetical protein
MLQTNNIQNIKFNEELFKMLDEDSDDEENICQITCLPLTDKFVKLECGHCFNYQPLYKEIITQKFFHNTYCNTYLSKKEKQIVQNANVNYFIKCPYCRNIQFSVLPYYPEFHLEEVYGVNSVEKEIRGLSSYELKSFCCKTHNYNDPDKTFDMYKTTFKYGQCSFVSSFSSEMTCCHYKYVAPIPDSDKTYCSLHYRLAFKQYVIEKRKRILKERLEKREAQLKLFEEKNAIRIAKGLEPLKKLPNIKKTNANVVNGNITVGEYIASEADVKPCCPAILKTGARKGQPCGSMTFGINGFCKRHDK